MSVMWILPGRGTEVAENHMEVFFLCGYLRGRLGNKQVASRHFSHQCPLLPAVGHTHPAREDANPGWAEAAIPSSALDTLLVFSIAEGSRFQACLCVSASLQVKMGAPRTAGSY